MRVEPARIRPRRARPVIGGTIAGLASILLACGGDAPPRAKAPPIWLARLEFPTADSARAKPTGLLAADLDGDKRDDLVAATRSPGGIEIWTALSPAIAPAPEPRRFACGDYPLGPVWCGAAPRAAIASRETLDLVVFDAAAALKAAAGAELPAVWRAKLPARPRALAGGVVDKDKKPAVAVITIEDELLVYRGPDAPQHVALAKEHAVCALLASDGERIVVGYQGSRKLALLHAGETPAPTADLPGLPRALLEADLDGDGDTELAVACGDDRLLVFGLARKADCGAWFEAPPLDVKVGSVPIALALATTGPEDARRATLAVVALHEQDVRVFSFAGGVPTEIAERAAGQRPVDIAFGDFDGDGAVDLAVANGDAKRVGVVFGAREAGSAEPRFAPEARVACDRAPSAIASGDLNADGHPDLAVIAAADETLSVLVGGFRGIVLDTSGIPAPGAQAVAVGDLEQKGRAGVGWLRRGAKTSSLVVGFPDPREFPIEGSKDATDLLFADLAGSGRSDAVVADPEQGFVAVLANRSAAELAFAAAQRTPVEAGPRALAPLHGAGGELRIAVAAGGPGASRGVVGSSRVDLQACKLEYSIVSPK